MGRWAPHSLGLLSSKRRGQSPGRFSRFPKRRGSEQRTRWGCARGLPPGLGPHWILFLPWPSTVPSTLGVNLSSCLDPPGGGLPGRSPLVGLSGSPPHCLDLLELAAPLCVSIRESHPSCFKTLRAVPTLGLSRLWGCGPAEAALRGSPKSTAPNVSPTSLGAQKPGRWTWSGGALSSCRLGHPVPTPSDRPELGS